MAISAIGYNKASVTGSASSFTPSYPAAYTAVANDLAVIAICQRGTTAPTQPSGWSTVTNSSQTVSGTYESIIFYKLLTTAQSLPAITVTLAASSGLSWAIAIYRGVDTGTILDPASGAATVVTTNNATCTAPAVSPVNTTNMLVCVFGGDISAETYSSPTNSIVIEAQSASATTNSSAVCLCDKILSASGTTGTSAVTQSSTATSVSISFAIKAAVTSADDPQYWKFWDNVSAVQQWQAVQAERVDVLLASLLYQYPQYAVPPAVGSTGVQLLKTFEDFSVRRIVAFQHGTQFPQTPPPPTDNPLYWDFWNQMSARTAGDRSTALRLASLHLLQAEYPQKPPPKPDDPLYWSFWNARARTLSEEARALQTRAAIALQLSQYPLAPPPPPPVPDDPQYWDFWNQLTGRTNADRISAIARLANLEFLQSQYPQTPPPPPDNPQYWSFWNDIASTRQRATSISSQTQASIFSLYQYPQTPPPAPDNPQYWAYWTDAAAVRQRAVSASTQLQASLLPLYQYPQKPPPRPDNPQYWSYWLHAGVINGLASSRISVLSSALQLFQFPQTPPPPPPDNPQYWSYWTSRAYPTYQRISTAALTSLLLYPQTPPPPPPVADNPQYWAYWTDATAAIIRQRAASNQVAAQAALDLAQYPQKPPPPPDNPQYWAFWHSEAVRISSELQSSRVRGVISELLTFLPAPPQPPPPPPDNPQYWAFWTDIAAMLNRQHSAAAQINITLAQLMSEYAQSPQPAPVVSAEAIVIWRIRGGF